MYDLGHTFHRSELSVKRHREHDCTNQPLGPEKQRVSDVRKLLIMTQIQNT